VIRDEEKEDERKESGRIRNRKIVTVAVVKTYLLPSIHIACAEWMRAAPKSIFITNLMKKRIEWRRVGGEE
jgi:hypothetical protein